MVCESFDDGTLQSVCASNVMVVTARVALSHSRGLRTLRTEYNFAQK
jgi:hypothetical protein